jgi:hypothetical protein
MLTVTSAHMPRPSSAVSSALPLTFRSCGPQSFDHAEREEDEEEDVRKNRRSSASTTQRLCWQAQQGLDQEPATQNWHFLGTLVAVSIANFARPSRAKQEETCWRPFCANSRRTCHLSLAIRLLEKKPDFLKRKPCISTWP